MPSRLRHPARTSSCSPVPRTPVSDYNHNTRKYTFKFPDQESVSGGGITHLLMIKAKEDGLVVDDAGKEVARPYTPISSPDTVGKIEFLIKKYDVGACSRHLCAAGEVETLTLPAPALLRSQTGKLTPYLATLKGPSRSSAPDDTTQAADPTLLLLLAVGDQALFKGPFPKFPYKKSELTTGVAIAGGSGITPMYQLIAHSLSVRP